MEGIMSNIGHVAIRKTVAYETGGYAGFSRVCEENISDNKRKAARIYKVGKHSKVVAPHKAHINNIY
jgi:hypothetical protein